MYPYIRIKDRCSAQPMCDLQVININTGDIVEYLRLEGVVRELYDVMVMPEVKRPYLLVCRRIKLNE